LFGGLTDERTAKQAVNRIFGSVDGKGDVGILTTAYTDNIVNLGSFGRDGWEQPIYVASGQLQWQLTKSIRKENGERLLSELLAVLHGLIMSLGGFGRGWRRPDHRIFKPLYSKTPIGCHWEWRNIDALPDFLHVGTSGDLADLLRRSRLLAERWLQTTGSPLGAPAPWREVIHPDRMLIWSRAASDTGNAEAIHLFHNPREGEPPRDPRDLRKSDLAGRMNLVGCIWNRLLPLDAGAQDWPVPKASATPMTRLGAATARPASATARPGGATARPAAGAMARPSNARKTIAPRGEVWMNYASGPFLESLVLFPEQRQSTAFINVMDDGAGVSFERLRFNP